MDAGTPNTNQQQLDPQQHLNFRITQMQQQYMQEFMRINAANAPSAQAFTNMMSPFLTGGRSMMELRASDNFFDKLVGNTLPLLGTAAAEQMGIGAGSTLSALQNMFSYGGMRVRDGSGALIPMNGYGFGAEMLAGQMFSTMQSQLWNPNGSTNMQGTYGLLPADVGATLNEVQRRGAFSGTIAGQLETLTSGRIDELKNQAINSGNQKMLSDLESMRPGETYVSMDPGLVTKVQAWQDEALSTVSALKQVFGNLRPEVLLQELESLTGMDLGRPGQMRAAAAQLQTIINQGTAAGMSPSEMLQFHAASSATLDSMLSNRMGMPVGSFARSAASMAEFVNAYALPAYDEHTANQGFRSRGEVATRKAADMASMLARSPEMLEAAWYAASMDAGSAGRAELMGGIEAMQNAGSADAQIAARRNLAAMVGRISGGRSGAALDVLGADSMMDFIATRAPEVMRSLGTSLAQGDQAAMVGDFRQIMGMFSGASRAFGGLDASATAMHSLFTNLSPQQRASMLEGDYGALRGVQAGSIQDVGAYLQSKAGSMSPGQLDQILGTVNAAVMTSPNLSSILSGAGRQQYDIATSVAALNNTDQRGRSSLSVVDKILQVALGGQLPETDRVMLDFAEGAGATIDKYTINKDLGLDVTPEQAQQLAKSMAGTGGNLYRTFGINPNDRDAAAQLAKAMAGAGGAGRVAELLGQDPGQIVGMSADDKGTSLRIARDPGALRKQYQEELDQIAGRKPEDKAKEAAEKGAARGGSMSGPLTITINAPNGSTTLGGAFDFKPNSTP